MALVVTDFTIDNSQLDAVDQKGYKHYFDLYTVMKVRHFFGHFENMSYNACRMTPPHVDAMLSIKKGLDQSNETYSDDSIVGEVLDPSTAAVGVDAFSGPLAAEEPAKAPLPPIGNVHVSVPLQNYIPIISDLPANVEFAAHAVLAKFKATRSPEINFVDIHELIDRDLVLRAQALFGEGIGRFVFPKTFEPYCWIDFDAHGEESFVCMRPSPRGRALRVKIADVWDIKKKPTKNTDKKEDNNNQVKCVLRFLFPSLNLEKESSYKCPVSVSSMYNLQAQYSEVDPKNKYEFPDKISAWEQIPAIVSAVVDKNDLFHSLRFLSHYIRKIEGYSEHIQGDKRASGKAISAFSESVRKVLIDFSARGLKRWVDPPPPVDDPADCAWLDSDYEMEDV